MSKRTLIVSIDLAPNLGGPAVCDRLRFFTGYQYLRDSDSQPGTVPAFPRITFAQPRLFADPRRTCSAWG